MSGIVTQGNLPHTSAEITFNYSYPPMPPSEGNKALLAKLSSVSEDLGFGSVTAYDPGKRGAADVSFVAAHLPVIDGLGAEGLGAHTTEESIDLSLLPQLTQRAALLTYRLGQSTR